MQEVIDLWNINVNKTGRSWYLVGYVQTDSPVLADINTLALAVATAQGRRPNYLFGHPATLMNGPWMKSL